MRRAKKARNDEESKKRKKFTRELKIVNGEINWDLMALIRTTVICRNIFKKTLKGKSSAYVEELKLTRHEIMHNNPFHETADRALDTMILLIQAMNGGEDAVNKLTTLRQWIASNPSTPAEQDPEKKPAEQDPKKKSAAQRPEKKPTEQRPEKQKDAEYYTWTGNNKLGDAQLNQRGYKAIEDYNKAIDLDPAYAPAYYNRSRANVLIEEYDKAIKDCDEAIRLYPNFASVYLSKGKGKFKLADAYH